jgi:hypothetical protein
MQAIYVMLLYTIWVICVSSLNFSSQPIPRVVYWVLEMLHIARKEYRTCKLVNGPRKCWYMAPAYMAYISLFVDEKGVKEVIVLLHYYGQEYHRIGKFLMLALFIHSTERNWLKKWALETCLWSQKKINFMIRMARFSKFISTKIVIYVSGGVIIS